MQETYTDTNSESSSVVTVKVQDENTNKEKKPYINHETSNVAKLGHEPIRFKSLTFISKNGSLSDRETSVKNANLKSELIENIKDDKNTKDSLFNNNTNNGPISITQQQLLNSNFPTNANSISNLMQKMSSTNTLQTIYTDAYSTLDFEETKSNNLVDTAQNPYNVEISPFDDINSIYQQSLHSNNPEFSAYSNNTNNNSNNNNNHNMLCNYHNNQKPKNNNAHSTNNNLNFTSNHQEDTESFIYNDTNSVDILSINDPKLQRRTSNNIAFLNNPFLKDNNHNNFNNNQNTNNLNPNIGSSLNNYFDFLDTQSVNTIFTNNDTAPYGINGPKSPISKRINYSNYKNHSLCSAYSKVRQVSQKILNKNNNSNTQGITNYSKINLNKKNDLDHIDEYDNHDEESIMRNGPDSNNNKNEREEFYDVDDHTGLTDAESLLAKPYRSKHYRLINQNRSLCRENSSSTVNQQSLNRSNNKEVKYIDYGSMNNGNYFDPVEEFNDYEIVRSSSNSPHDYKSMYYRQNIILNFIISSLYIFVLILIIFSILKLVVLENFDNAINSFEILNLDNILLSDEILLFDIKSEAINFNFQDIYIWDIDLDIFIVTDESNLKLHNDDGDNTDKILSKELTILLGNSIKFLTPFNFEGLLKLPKWSDVWNNWKNIEDIRPSNSDAQLKLYKPGKSFLFQGKPLSREQWIQMLSSTYKIILRGNLKYSLPLVRQDQFISISTEIQINPI